MIVIVDGPEKAGKSTFIRQLARVYEGAGVNVEVRHWGPVSPDDRVYTPRLQEDMTSKLTIWDRCWASEHVYGKLLGRDRRLANDPWLGEWYHARAVQAIGVRLMLLGPSVEWLLEHRDGSDLKVDPAMERELFREYGERFGWMTVENSPETMSLVLFETANKILEASAHSTPRPPIYCGPPNAPVVFVGEARSDKLPPGGWLPFSTKHPTEFGRKLGDAAFKCGWTNAHDCPPQFLRGREMIVACGRRAESWVHHYVWDSSKTRTVGHPSWMYRFNTAAAGTAALHADEVLEEVLTVLEG